MSTLPAGADYIVRSSYADIYIERATGRIVKIDYEAMGGETEFDDVDRFDPATLTVDDEEDVLCVGFWTKDGNYVPSGERW